LFLGFEHSVLAYESFGFLFGENYFTWDFQVTDIVDGFCLFGLAVYMVG
jgi:hypothetical protein